MISADGLIYAAAHVESPQELWRRLTLGREELLQRLLTKGEGSTGRAITPEGEEFGYELRSSRYKTMQIKP